MKKFAFALAWIAVTMFTSSDVMAQKTATKVPPVISAPDLTKLNVEKLLQQLQPLKTSALSATNPANSTNAAANASSEDVTPGQVIAEFLQLTPNQINEFAQLLQARQAALVPLAQQGQVLGQQLQALLANGGTPAQVGVTVIQIHAVQTQILQVQQAFLTQLVSMFAPDQLQRLQAVQIAIQLQPILPAFQLIFIF
jgi:hypothetical protein